MTHTIRQRVINELGQKVTKIYKVEGELGSGILDKNGKEIFDNDRVKFGDKVITISFKPFFRGDPSKCEIIGHADDQN